MAPGCRACVRMAEANIPHNVFISDGGRRAWLLPNAFAASKAKGCISEELLDSQVCADAVYALDHLQHVASLTAALSQPWLPAESRLLPVSVLNH